MNHLLRLLGIGLIGLLAAACASGTVEISPTAPPAQTAAPVDDAQGAAPAQQVSEVRPQFLNSYADW